MGLLVLMILAGMFIHSCWGQDLAPRAYNVTPLHSNAINLTYSFFNGGLNFGGVVPIAGATGMYSVPSFSYYHSFSFFGRSANITAGLPYGLGTFQGSVIGTNQQLYRSGLLDLGFRFSAATVTRLFLAPTLGRFGLRRTELKKAYVWIGDFVCLPLGVAFIRQHSSAFTNQTSLHQS